MSARTVTSLWQRRFFIWGDEALAAVAVILAVYVPFREYCKCLDAGSGTVPSIRVRRTGAWTQLSATLLNPLVIACAAGLTLSYMGLGLPIVVERSLDLAGRAALPLALLAIGASLRGWTSSHAAPVWIATASAVKLVALPAITYSIAVAVELSPVSLAAAVLTAAMPAAASAYPMTRELGGDAEFIASAITVQTILAASTIPFAGRWSRCGCCSHTSLGFLRIHMPTNEFEGCSGPKKSAVSCNGGNCLTEA